MTVQDLIDRLTDMDPDAKVYLMTQEGWPFENSIKGVTLREEIEDEDDDPNLNSSDVFIVEGSQLRYGNRDAWNVC